MTGSSDRFRASPVALNMTMRCKAADPMMCEVESLGPNLTDAQCLTPRDLTKALIKLQSFEGSFSLSTVLATILDVSMVELEAKIRSCGIGLAERLKKELPDFLLRY